MKKMIMLTATLVMVTVLTGCLATLHPLFTEKDLVFDDRLLGRWQAGEGDDTAVFEQGSPSLFHELPERLKSLSNNAYMVTIKQKNGVNRYHAFLCRIGKELYLDYFPAETKSQRGYDPFYKSHFVKMHSFYRVRFTNDASFEIGQFDEQYLRNLIDKKQVRIQHEVRWDGSYVITAPTEQLQQYVVKYSNDDGAYNSSTKTTYHKIP